MSTAPSQVLVVDDEPQVRDLTSRALIASGFKCDTATDGNDALRLARDTSYDAVVTDLRMPNKHGHSLCVDLLGLPHPPSVMVLTGLSDPRIVMDLMGRGVHDVVQKPVNYDILAFKVRAMIDQARLKRTAVAPPSRKPLARKVNLLHQIESTLVELSELMGERLDAVFDVEGELPDPPRAVREYIRRLAESEVLERDKPTAVVLPGHETRRADRVTCFTAVIAAPVDSKMKRIGEPFKLALRDLSESGARLLHTRATNARHLALYWNATQLVAKQIRVVCEVRRCQPCGPFYDIGGQFVMAD